MTVLRVKYNLFAGTETLSLLVYEPIAICVLWGTAPPFGGRDRVGGRVWYPAKVLHIRNNLFAGAETLSLSV